MKEEKTTLTSVIFNDVFMIALSLIACFGIIAIFAVGGFCAICSLVGFFKSFASANIAIGLLISACGIVTAILMFYFEYYVCKSFLDGISDYAIDRKAKVAQLKNSDKNNL